MNLLALKEIIDNNVEILESSAQENDLMRIRSSVSLSMQPQMDTRSFRPIKNTISTTAFVI